MKVCALAGGVGGAKLASGLQDVLPPGELSVVVNTADDFDLWGLHICPDLDTVMYTLAGISNPETGWGIVNESFETLTMLESFGEGPNLRPAASNSLTPGSRSDSNPHRVVRTIR